VVLSKNKARRIIPLDHANQYLLQRKAWDTNKKLIEATEEYFKTNGIF